MATLSEAASRLAIVSASVATYCDRAEHLEATDRESIGTAGAELRDLAFELAATNNIDLVESYRARLLLVERRHPLYPAGGFVAANEIGHQGVTWRQLQSVQWDHDRHYHPDVLGLSRYEQLRHYAFHLAKLAGAATQAADKDPSDFLERRLPDLLLFGLKLATLVNEQLPEQPLA